MLLAMETLSAFQVLVNTLSVKSKAQCALPSLQTTTR